MSDQELVDNMEGVWRSIDSLCSSFVESQWKTPTDCPGWSVQDQLSYLVGSESRILGRSAPDHTPASTDNIRNDVGARNEVVVDWRRSWPGSRVLEEFRQVTGERLRSLRAMSVEDFAQETQTPIGPGTISDYLRIRIFDAWVHLQDIRRAVGVPGDLEGPVAEHSMARVAMAMPYVVAKKAEAHHGTIVVFEITGSAGRTVAVEVEENRGLLLDTVPDAPTVALTMDFETFACLGCGRWDPAATLRSGKVHIDGDPTLGEAIVSQMSFMI